MRRARSTATPNLDRAHRLRLAAEALADERTVAAVYRGGRVQSTSRLRVEEAARRLGYPLPPAAFVGAPADLVAMARRSIVRSRQATARKRETGGAGSVSATEVQPDERGIAAGAHRRGKRVRSRN